MSDLESRRAAIRAAAAPWLESGEVACVVVRGAAHRARLQRCHGDALDLHTVNVESRLISPLMRVPLDAIEKIEATDEPIDTRGFQPSC